MADPRHHCEGEHDERYMTVPSVPGSGFVMIEPEFVLCGFETVFNSPPIPLDCHQGLRRRSGRAPDCEEGHVAIGDGPPDQQASSPKAGTIITEGGTIEIGELYVYPIVQPRPFRSLASREPLPSLHR